VKNINVLNNSDVEIDYTIDQSIEVDLLITSSIVDFEVCSKIIFIYKDQVINSERVLAYFVENMIDKEKLSMEYGIEQHKIVLLRKNPVVQLNDFIQDYYKKNVELFSRHTINTGKNYWHHNDSKIELDEIGQQVVVESRLEKNEFSYVHYNKISGFNTPKNFDLKLATGVNYQLVFKGALEGEIDVKLCLLIGNDKEVVVNEQLQLDRKLNFHLNDGCENGKLVLRVSGPGKFVVDKILLLDDVEDEREYSPYLILTNIYPSEESLYRNAFVHRRVKSYMKNDLKCDVFAVSSNSYLVDYEYDSVEVMVGNEGVLRNLLRNGNYKKILIHFVNQQMLGAIESSGTDAEVVIWVHGYEVLSYKRRLCNFKEATDEEIKNQIKLDKDKLKMLQSIQKNGYSLVFVSNWLRNALEEDYKLQFVNCSIISNVVDGDYFRYIEKSLDKRAKILSIRPFSAVNYATDLIQDVIVELSKKSYFKNLSFTVVGDGPLHEKNTALIKGFDNVKIEKKFLPQNEIVDYHKKHGVFLCPTRADTQGVSISEAMSSGLVPVTNKIQAIPEFIPETCGFLAEENNVEELVQGIEKLYYDMSLFRAMSQESSYFIQEKCSVETVIRNELDLILNRTR